jgi:hypothetical protein
MAAVLTISLNWGLLAITDEILELDVWSTETDHEHS